MSRLGWSATRFQASAASRSVTFPKGKRLRLGFRERGFRGAEPALSGARPASNLVGQSRLGLRHFRTRGLLIPSLTRGHSPGFLSRSPFRFLPSSVSPLGWSASRFQGSAACLRVTFWKGKRLRLGYREREFRGSDPALWPPVTFRCAHSFRGVSCGASCGASWGRELRGGLAPCPALAVASWGLTGRGEGDVAGLPVRPAGDHKPGAKRK